MKNYIMAIDQGTTSSRAVLFDAQGKIRAISQKETNSYFPKPGWVEQDADEIYSSVVSVVWEMLSRENIDASMIAAIGITNQRETTIIWDKKTGKPVYHALVWQSRQSAPYCEELKHKGLEPWIHEKTGLRIDSYFSSSKIRWILDHIEDGQKRAERGELLFGTVDTWLMYKLSQGKVFVTDVSNASRTMLMNSKTLDWDDELLELFNIPRCMLAEIRDTSEVYGFTEEHLFGAPIAIAAAAGDQQAALFGQLCIQAGDVKNTYGTGCFLLMNIGDKPVLSQTGLLCTVGWRMKGKTVYALEGSVFVAGAAVQWLRDSLHFIRNASESEAMALSVPDSHGVIVVPSFVGLGAPYWRQDLSGAIFGLNRDTSQAHIVRATLESLAYQTNDVLEAMLSEVDMQTTALKVDGGASMNHFLMQFQADCSNVEVIRPLTQESTALGAAFFAGLAVGFWPNTEALFSLNPADRTFVPSLAEESRKASLERWKTAIAAVSVFK